MLKDKKILSEHVKHDAQSDDGNTLVCIHCQREYTRGLWDFYSLCPKCFSIFDALKMQCRTKDVGFEGKSCETYDDFILIVNELNNLSGGI